MHLLLYLPNPRMEIQVGSEWFNVYDTTGVFQESNLQNPRVAYLAEQIEEWRKNLKDPLA